MGQDDHAADTLLFAEHADISASAPSAAYGHVRRHPIQFMEGNVANLMAAASGPQATRTAVSASQSAALPSFLSAALTWGLGASATGTSSAATCSGSSFSGLNGSEPLPENMLRSLKAARPQVNWKELYRLRHGHYYTGEVAAPPTDLQKGIGEQARKGSALASDETCDLFTGGRALSSPVANDVSKRIGGAPGASQKHAAALQTEGPCSQGTPLLGVRSVSPTRFRSREQISTANVNAGPTDGRQPHGHGVLLYIVYGCRRCINRSTHMAPSTAVAESNSAPSDIPATSLIPLALVPRAYCPLVDLFDRSTSSASTATKLCSTPASSHEGERSETLQEKQEHKVSDDEAAVVSLVIYEGNFWRGRPHREGRLLVFQHYILEGGWHYGAPLLKDVCVFRKILAHQIKSQNGDQHVKGLDHAGREVEGYDICLHANGADWGTAGLRSTLSFSEQYMGTLAISIGSSRTLSAPWYRRGGLSWVINPKISFLYDGHGEVFSSPGGHTQFLSKKRPSFAPCKSSIDHKAKVAVEKGITWYCGEWVAGERHGFGAEWLSAGPNRGLYIGSYEHQQQHGSGVLEHDDGNVSPSSAYGNSGASALFGTWKCGVLQPSANLLFGSGSFMSLQSAHWNFTANAESCDTAPSKAFLFDQALLVKRQHSLSGLWEPAFRKLDVALASLPPLESQLISQLREHDEDVAVQCSEDEDKGRRLYEHLRPILQVIVSLNEWQGVLSTFQRLFYFIFGRCPGNKTAYYGRGQLHQPRRQENARSEVGDSCGLIFSSNRNAERDFQDAHSNFLGADTLLRRLEQLGNSTTIDGAFDSSRCDGGLPLSHPLYSSPSWCQLIGLSTANEVFNSSFQLFGETQENLVRVAGRCDFERQRADEIAARKSEDSGGQRWGCSCLHAYGTVSAYPSLSATRRLTPSATVERGCHYAASFVDSLRLRLMSYVALHLVTCEKVVHHKVLQQVGWNIVYRLIGPLLYDLCNAVVIQQSVGFIGAYLRNNRNIGPHHSCGAPQWLGKNQCLSFSPATQHDMRLSDFHAAVYRLMQETNVAQGAAVKQANPVLLSGTGVEEKNIVDSKDLRATLHICDDSFFEPENIDATKCMPFSLDRRVVIDPEDKAIIRRAACVFSSPTLSLAVWRRRTPCDFLFLWGPSPRTPQSQDILHTLGGEGALLSPASSLTGVLDTLTALVHASANKYPDEPLLQQQWLGLCVLAAAREVEEVLVGSGNQGTQNFPLCEEVLRQAGFSPFAGILLVCLTMLGVVSPVFPLTSSCCVLLNDLGKQRHRDDLQKQFCAVGDENLAAFNEGTKKNEGHVLKTETEASLTSVLRAIFDASCRLVHCYPHLLQSVGLQHNMDNACVCSLDELHIRAQYCASFCGGQHILRQVLAIRKGQQCGCVELLNNPTSRMQTDARTCFPSFTRHGHAFSSCTLNEATVSTLSPSRKSSLYSALNLTDPVGGSIDKPEDLKALFMKTLRLTRDTMSVQLAQYWSELSSRQSLPVDIRHAKNEEEDDKKDCMPHAGMLEGLKKPSVLQMAPVIVLECVQAPWPPITPFPVRATCGDDSTLSELTSWIFRCMYTALQDADTELSSRSNAHVRTTTSEVGMMERRNCCGFRVYTWKHFVYGFQQQKQGDPLAYHSVTGRVSALPQLPSKCGHLAKQQQLSQEQSKAIDEKARAKANSPTDMIATASSYHSGSANTNQGSASVYPPLLSEEDFCYVALLASFLAEFNIKMELQVCFIQDSEDNDDDVGSAEMDTVSLTPACQGCMQLTINVNKKGERGNEDTNKKYRIDSRKSLLQSPSSDLTTNDLNFVTQALERETKTDKDTCNISEILATGTSLMGTPSPPCTATDKAEERYQPPHSLGVCRSLLHCESEGIQGKELALTLSLPATFPQSLVWEVLEDAWSTVAALLGENALFSRAKRWKR